VDSRGTSFSLRRLCLWGRAQGGEHERFDLPDRFDRRDYGHSIFFWIAVTGRYASLSQSKA
jgi:hypothetical protein